jgi:hypothetical protein
MGTTLTQEVSRALSPASGAGDRQTANRRGYHTRGKGRHIVVAYRVHRADQCGCAVLHLRKVFRALHVPLKLLLETNQLLDVRLYNQRVGEREWWGEVESGRCTFCPRHREVQVGNGNIPTHSSRHIHEQQPAHHREASRQPYPTKGTSLCREMCTALFSSQRMITLRTTCFFCRQKQRLV